MHLNKSSLHKLEKPSREPLVMFKEGEIIEGIWYTSLAQNCLVIMLKLLWGFEQLINHKSYSFLCILSIRASFFPQTLHLH